MDQNIEHKHAVLASLAGPVQALVARHIEQRKNLWMPSELIFPAEIDREVRISDLRHAAERVSLPERVVYALNLLTEEGLPSYFQLLAQHLGLDSIFSQWIYRWTAEENRHGQLLGDLARVSGLISRMDELERQQFAYLQSGFRPRWQNDPYQLFGYTAVQEDATRISHGRESQLLSKTAGSILAKPVSLVAGEENFHGHVYAEIVRHIFEVDPDGMIVALRKAIGNFAMPGKSMPQYEDLAQVAMRLGVFTPLDLKEILERLLGYWRVPHLPLRTDEAKRARDVLMCVLPQAWQRQMRRLQQVEPRRFTFLFLGNESFVL